MASPLSLQLCARDQELEHSWRTAFSGCEGVTVVAGDILSLEADALVSPANSFGFMDGGLDLIYSQHFGWELEGRVRARILEAFHGELPVGRALVVPTEHPRVPWLISAPTMRVPMRIEHTPNAYLAFRAVLIEALAHPGIHRVLCPGLGTGVGRMPPDRCARQMRAAHDAILGGQPLRKGGLAAAVRHHMHLIE